MRYFLTLMLFIALCFLSYIGRATAETLYFKDKPANLVTADAAAKFTVEKPAWQCQRVKRGPNINPVKVPGTNSVWSSDPGKGIEDVAALLDGGKTGYRCKTMALDKMTGRMKAAN